jgi:hypothetical protein
MHTLFLDFRRWYQHLEMVGPFLCQAGDPVARVHLGPELSDGCAEVWQGSIYLPLVGSLSLAQIPRFLIESLECSLGSISLSGPKF